MSDVIIEVDNLRKEYSPIRGNAIVAVDGLDLTVGSQGRVHGFLGPNGSGKTTTIRCILGLVRPTSGAIRVFGEPLPGGLHNAIPRIGALVENPKMFPKFSGRKNLSLLADIGGFKKPEVDRVLETVGLADRDKDTFQSYSLGMKQRLAIAATLLKDPDLLILDEPANGLDPAGIAEMRTLIRRIADDGKAVLVSSHQLAEIEQVCDEVTIIDRGRLIRSGSLDDVVTAGGPSYCVVTIDNREEAVRVLTSAGLNGDWGEKPDEIVVHVEPQHASEVTRLLADAGMYLRGLRPQKATLESAFLELTDNHTPDPGPPPPPPIMGGGQ